MDNLVTQAEFARRAGFGRSYVTQLKKAGRLVMDGNRVLVDESLQRIEATKDPNRDDVAQRHAQHRAGESAPLDHESGDSYQSARALKEKYSALQAKADYEQAIGKLVEHADVKRAGLEIGITLRTAMENLPDQLAAELAPISDPIQIHALMVEQVEEVLHKVSNKIDDMAREGAQ